MPATDPGTEIALYPITLASLTTFPCASRYMFAVAAAELSRDNHKVRFPIRHANEHEPLRPNSRLRMHDCNVNPCNAASMALPPAFITSTPAAMPVRARLPPSRAAHAPARSRKIALRTRQKRRGEQRQDEFAFSSHEKFGLRRKAESGAARYRRLRPEVHRLDELLRLAHQLVESQIIAGDHRWS